MDRAPHERDVAPSNNNGHPMLSPIRTAPPPSAAPHMGPVSNSTRLPFFQDQASAHGWNNHHHLPSSVHTSSSSALAHAALDPASYTNQRPPPIIQTNLSHFAPTPDVDYDPSSGARFPTQLTPLDSSPLGHTSHPSASHIPNSGSSPVTATAKGSRGPGSRGPRSKPPVSIANKNTAGSGSASSSGGPTGQAGRNSQPKSTRKQFSACGSCQYRQVKCDLKDKVFQEGEKASCTACIDRGINCVSAYPQAQKPKAQRRGKRIINVE
ncbi:hypothetical protein DL93DRAFT_1862070 [Clavulina sp. PMI_390]|nr:hypothetical protein DL93DRAFT_1862070 [Clavulina sp. PMI_390]